MTWTSAFGRGCGVLLDAIVRWLALARINPNVLTFLGLVVNTIAAFLFGYANSDSTFDRTAIVTHTDSGTARAGRPSSKLMPGADACNISKSFRPVTRP